MKTKFLRGFGFLTALVLICFTVLTGCPVETTEDDPFPSNLVDTWSNGATGDAERTFTIKSNGDFTVVMNPMGPAGRMGKGTVTGKLRFANGEYQMDNMSATLETPDPTGQGWNTTVSNFDKTWVQLTFLPNNNNTFVLSCADEAGETDQTKMPVTAFFGGQYTRQ
jgi:hypothetical protein